MAEPMKICGNHLCNRLTPEDGPARCGLCRVTGRKAYDKQRGSSAKRGYDRHWRRAREAFLAEHPVCEVTYPYPIGCVTEGLKTPATVVDHKVPHAGNAELFWDRANWQRACGPCHSLKTALEDGRWAPRPGSPTVVSAPTARATR